MFFIKSIVYNIFIRAIPLVVLAVFLCTPIDANAAQYAIVDALNLAPLIPTILDALMAVATGGYEFLSAMATVLFIF